MIRFVYRRRISLIKRNTYVPNSFMIKFLCLKDLKYDFANMDGSEDWNQIRDIRFQSLCNNFIFKTTFKHRHSFEHNIHTKYCRLNINKSSLHAMVQFNRLLEDIEEQSSFFSSKRMLKDYHRFKCYIVNMRELCSSVL